VLDERPDHHVANFLEAYQPGDVLAHLGERFAPVDMRARRDPRQDAAGNRDRRDLRERLVRGYTDVAERDAGPRCGLQVYAEIVDYPLDALEYDRVVGVEEILGAFLESVGQVFFEYREPVRKRTSEMSQAAFEEGLYPANYVAVRVHVIVEPVLNLAEWVFHRHRGSGAAQLHTGEALQHRCEVRREIEYLL